ncbi:MAG: BatD family protein [Limisphaerales bacterium]
MVTPDRNLLTKGLRGFLHWPFLVVCALALTFRASAEPSFHAELAPDSVGAGDSATLRLIFTDLGDVEPPTLPAVTNATIRYQGVSQQISIVNFSRSTSLIHQYQVQAQNPGLVQIPALAVEAGGQTFTSAPLTLRVGQGFDISRIGFLRLVVPRTEVYVGESFPVEIRFYYRETPARQAPPTLKLDGFIKGQQTVENLPPETITNLLYSVVRWNIALTAVKAGDLSLGPAEFQTLYVFQTQRRSRGMNSLFEPLFGGGEQRQLTFQSEPLTLKVINPPAAGRPPQFTGAVGQFHLNITASPTNVAAGDPVTVRVDVTGRGNFDGLRLPDLPGGSGFQLYPGTNSFTPADPLGLSGKKTFEAVIIPESPGVHSLKWPVLAYWDPSAKAYRSDADHPLSIHVRPGSQSQAQPVGTVPGPAEPRTPPDSVNPKLELPLLPDLGPLVEASPSRVTQPWFWWVLTFPLWAYALANLAPTWKQHWDRNRRPSVRDEAERRLTAHVRSMQEAAASGRAAEFFSHLNEALQERIALAVGGIVGSFTSEVIDQRLVPAGFTGEDAARLRALLDRIAEARFSPDSSTSELAGLLTEAESTLKALERLPRRA